MGNHDDLMAEALRAIEGLHGEKTVSESVSESGTTQEEIAALQSKLAAQRKEISEQTERMAVMAAQIATQNDRIARMTADFEQYRRRVTRDQESAREQAQERVALAMLPVIDNLERALAHAHAGRDFESFLDGVEMTHRLYAQALAKLGCTSYESVGAECDPVYHDVLRKVEDDTVPHNVVIREHLKGYRMHDRVLRPALVDISQRGAKALDVSDEGDGK